MYPSTAVHAQADFEGIWVVNSRPGAPAIAHHSTVYFDLDAEVVHENVRVVQFHVANPHGVLVYAVTDDAGNEVVWNAELPSANFTMRGGVFESMLDPGDIVPVVVGWPGIPDRTREISRD